MVLDPALCYRALLSRDRRFDGRFYTGVVTTGVFCRPVCPARAPHARNVRFFATAAAAAEAGFRPCRRCRPEAAPGAAPGTTASVRRALRLIADGALDRMSVGALADRLGMTERHLRRLFEAELGASPLAVALTRRLHFARRLLDETALPVARVADGAGFGSVRRFHAAFRRSYGRSPLELRRSAARQRSARVATPEAAIELRLAFRPPFDAAALFAFLAARALPGVERVDGLRYRRTIGLSRGAEPARAGILEARVVAERSALVVSLPVGLGGDLIEAASRLRRLFDLDAEPAAIEAVLARDPWLAPLVGARPGLRVPGCYEPFEVAVRAILGQQVSVRAATTLAARLVARFGVPLGAAEGAAGEGLTRLFPGPERLVDAPLEGLGMPASRAQAIRGLAQRLAGGEALFAPAPTLEAAVARLQGLAGIGRWTAEYVALRVLGEPDAFPLGDLGLRQALSQCAGRELTDREVAARAERWRPWRAYATLQLWASLGKQPAQAGARRAG